MDGYTKANPADAFMRQLLKLAPPALNDCDYPSRFEYEDMSRALGWGIEGEGMCDYPGYCPLYREHRCPLDKEE